MADPSPRPAPAETCALCGAAISAHRRTDGAAICPKYDTQAPAPAGGGNPDPVEVARQAVEALLLSDEATAEAPHAGGVYKITPDMHRALDRLVVAAALRASDPAGGRPDDVLGVLRRLIEAADRRENGGGPGASLGLQQAIDDARAVLPEAPR